MQEPIVQQTKPLLMEMKAGKYFWCSCGKSQKAAFCDGSHMGMGLKPLRVLIEKDMKVAWCMCKHTKNPPFCDGTHNTFK